MGTLAKSRGRNETQQDQGSSRADNSQKLDHAVFDSETADASRVSLAPPNDRDGHMEG